MSWLGWTEAVYYYGWMFCSRSLGCTWHGTRVFGGKVFCLQDRLGRRGIIHRTAVCSP